MSRANSENNRPDGAALLSAPRKKARHGTGRAETPSSGRPAPSQFKCPPRRLYTLQRIWTKSFAT